MAHVEGERAVLKLHTQKVITAAGFRKEKHTAGGELWMRKPDLLKKMAPELKAEE